MGTFRAGQKVVCVKTYPWWPIAVGDVFKITAKFTCCRDYIGFDVWFANTPCRCPNCLSPAPVDGRTYFIAECFRPLIEDLTASLASKEVERLVPEAPERVNEPQHV